MRGYSVWDDRKAPAAHALRQILRQLLARGGAQGRQVAIARMIAADARLDRRIAEGGDLCARHAEMQEVHGRGLAVVARALDVALRQARAAARSHLKEEAVLDPAELGQDAGAADRIVDLEQDRRHQLVALRDERVVGGELVGDLRLAALLGQQHLLHLEQHRFEALEQHGAPGAEMDATQRLDRHQLGAAGLALGAVLFVGDQVGAGDAAFARGHQSAPSASAKTSIGCSWRGVGPSPGCASTSAPRCRHASGQSEQSAAFSFCATWRAVGRPTFTAWPRVAFMTPNVPPWPEQRSITSTRVSGISRSISADLTPIACARAWQAWCRVTPPATGVRPSGAPCALTTSTTYSPASRVAS